MTIIAGQDRREPRPRALADILAEDVHLQLEFAIHLIAVDGEAGPRSNELEPLESRASPLMCDRISPLMKQRAAKGVAVVTGKKDVLW